MKNKKSGTVYKNNYSPDYKDYLGDDRPHPNQEKPSKKEMEERYALLDSLQKKKMEEKKQNNKKKNFSDEREQN